MSEGDLPQILRLLISLAFVISLMGGLAYILKRLGLSTGGNVSHDKRRLKVIEALTLDGRHRAVLLQRDNKQHLVILGPNSETLIETDITPIEGSNEYP